MVHGFLYRYYSRTRRNGEREFYEGLTGKRLVEDIQQAGGIITMQVSIFSKTQNKKLVCKKLL